MMKYVTNLTDILTAVSQQYGIPQDVLTSTIRSKPINYVRHVAIYLACNLTYLSKDDIASRFNMKDHGSLPYGYKKIASLMAKDHELKSQITTLINRLASQ